MVVTRDINLSDFKFWSGAANRAKYLTTDELDQLGYMLEELYPEGLNETAINDFLWFEEDTVAEWLGFNSFDEIMSRNG